MHRIAPSSVYFRRLGLIGSRRARRRALALLLLATLSTAQGCYAYHAVEVARLQPGEQIRLQLKQSAYDSIAPSGSVLGPRALEGRFVKETEDSLTFSVWVGAAYQGTPFATSWEEFTLPLSDVVKTENRQLSKGRTAVVAVATLVTIATLIHRLGVITFFGGGQTPPPPPPSSPLRH